MIRTETYCGGRLVKEVAQVDIMTAQTLRHEWVDGRHRWLLDGTEITDADQISILVAAGLIGA